MDEISRTLGSLEAKVEGLRKDVESIREWQERHEGNHHGLRGWGPGHIVSRNNAKFAGVVTVAVAIAEGLRYWLGA
ncbi:MAG: hypothetical protein Q8Q08_00940 [Candidatus Omnitrophota bacterium]|nr:hypothetical protein [Candidatus Omnitrophota bacterium]MDZ4250906.1 hypothetical protein [Candidatus Nanopelagicales bacterium]